jgi:hypothetical protein
VPVAILSGRAKPVISEIALCSPEPLRIGTV